MHFKTKKKSKLNTDQINKTTFIPKYLQDVTLNLVKYASGNSINLLRALPDETLSYHFSSGVSFKKIQSVCMPEMP